MRIRTLAVSAMAASLALAMAAPTTVTIDASVPGAVLQTNPIGTLGWLPISANERAGFNTHRMVVIYDASQDASGADTDLIATDLWGMKLFSDSPSDLDATATPPVTLVAHSEFVSSLDDVGAPGEVDEAFIGLSGDVRDGDCAGASDGTMSFAYSTTFTVDGEADAADCQVISAQTTDADGTVTSTTITEYVPGFWFDVRWPEDSDPAGDGGNGRVFSQLWYGAIPGYNTSDPMPFAQAANSGFSNTVRNPGDVFVSATLEDTVAGPTALAGCYGTGDFYELTVPAMPAGARGLRVDLYPTGDWDMQVTVDGTPTGTGGGTEGQSGNFAVNESISLFSVSEGDVFTIEGCNFAGGPNADLTISWT